MQSNPMEWYEQLASRLLTSPTVARGEWQSIDVSKSNLHVTYEMIDARVFMRIPSTQHALIQQTRPNLAWADEHFDERVSGIPHNPPPSHKRWPWARHNADHQDNDELFTHTYPERFWGRYTGARIVPQGLQSEIEFRDGNAYARMPDGTQKLIDTSEWKLQERQGIRFRYGDLHDVVTLLLRRPLTRQAYLPVWFPEDTGVVHGGRVPCTLGYHFMTQGEKLHCWYAMRSCDLVRHLRDDVYLAGRLMQWVCDHMNDGPIAPSFGQLWVPGDLHMTISSLHAFVGDRWTLEQMQMGKLK